MIEPETNQKRDINKAIKKALETLELDLESFKKIAGKVLTKNLMPENQLDLNHAPVIDVIEIIELLHLSSSHLHNGYDQEKHLANICHSIEKNQFRYKKGKLVKVAWKKFKWERWKYEAEFLGFRLRWKVRFKRIFKLIAFSIFNFLESLKFFKK